MTGHLRFAICPLKACSYTSPVRLTEDNSARYLAPDPSISYLSRVGPQASISYACLLLNLLTVGALGWSGVGTSQLGDVAL